MHEKSQTQAEPQRTSEIKQLKSALWATSRTLYESAAQLRKLAQRVDPDRIQIHWLIGETMTELQKLCKEQNIDT